MLPFKRIKFSFVHGFVLGVELFEYTTIELPKDSSVKVEDVTVEEALDLDDIIIKKRSGLLTHLGPFKMLVI